MTTLATPLAPANPHTPHTSAAPKVPHRTRRGSCVDALCFSSTSRTTVSRWSSPWPFTWVSRLRRALPAVLRPSKHASSTPSFSSLGAPASGLGSPCISGVGQREAEADDGRHSRQILPPLEREWHQRIRQHRQQPAC